MQLSEVSTSLIFRSKRVAQELITDALLFFAERLKKLGVELDGIYPGDPGALPFAMLLSNALSVPIKSENFLSRSSRIFVVFSAVPFEGVSETYISEKMKIIRERFPFSPSLVVLSSRELSNVDFQLLKAPVERVFSYQFVREVRRNYFWPVREEVIHVTEELWNLSKKEARNFLRAKRIRDSARRYLREEEIVELQLSDPDVDLSVWERFVKGKLTDPEVEKKSEKGERIRVEKLFQVEDKTLSSAVTSVLEYIAQGLEFHFPTHLAYSNLEVVEKEGVVIVPRITEELNGADIRVEFIVRSKDVKKSIEKVISVIRESFRELTEDIFGEKIITPFVDRVYDAELGRGSVYLSWFMDREMGEELLKKVNRRWLMTRLLYRKRFKTEVKELLKLLNNFQFTTENFEFLRSRLIGLWKKNPNILKAKFEEIKETIEENGLWPLIAALLSNETFPEELSKFLLKMGEFENVHHLLAEIDVYYVPVKTKRIYRPNWERVIREKEEFFLKAEPLNPKSPVTYVLQTADGKFLGELPTAVSHYIAAKERQGKKVACRELYFEPDVFSENSYWIEVRCL